MPTTFNGIGTSYFGKENLDEYRGRCEHCKREGQLRSYDTRLFFVILFVPVIPLGRKHILDMCPRCRRHRAIPLGQWQEQKRQAVADRERQVSEQPESAEAVMDLLATRVSLRDFDLAGDRLRGLETRFAANPAVLMQLGAYHEEAGDRAASDRCFLAAHQADEADLAARSTAARVHLRNGDLSRADSLARGLEQPGPGQDLGLLVMLGNAYQEQGQHQQALDVFSRVLAVHPGANEDARFRKAVLRSEKLANVPTSLLRPSRKARQRRIAVAAALAVVAGVPLYVNYHIQTHRTLHVLNGLAVPVTVSIDEASPIQVGARGLKSVELAEGEHVARLRDGAIEPVHFTVASSWLGRFTEDPAFVLNLEGAAILVWERILYSANPDGTDGDYRFHLGEPFVSFDDVDYAFQPFPEQLQVKEERTWKTRVGRLEADPREVVGSEAGSPDQQMTFAEAHLRHDPQDPGLIDAYLLVAGSNGAAERCHRFLSEGIARRPLEIHWHRAYQESAKALGRGGELPVQYDEMLRREPEDSGLHYLRGRLEPTVSRALARYARAIELDPESPYPWMARAFHLEQQGRFGQALEAAKKAAGLDTGQAFRETLDRLRIAAGKFPSLRRDLEARRRAEPLSFDLHLKALEASVLGGNAAAAREENERYLQEIEAQRPDLLPDLQRLASLRLHYLRGDLEPMLQELGESPRSRADRWTLTQTLLELGRDEEARETMKELEIDDAITTLLFGLVAAIRGDRARFQQAYDAAGAGFDAGDLEESRVAEVLGRGSAVSFEEANDLVLRSPGEKAAVLVGLALQRPSCKARLLDLASRLNYRLTYPHYLLERAIAVAAG